MLLVQSTSPWRASAAPSPVRLLFNFGTVPNRPKWLAQPEHFWTNLEQTMREKSDLCLPSVDPPPRSQKFWVPGHRFPSRGGGLKKKPAPSSISLFFFPGICILHLWTCMYQCWLILQSGIAMESFRVGPESPAGSPRIIRREVWLVFGISKNVN